MRYVLIIIYIFLTACASISKEDSYLFKELTILAKKNSPEAQYNLGMFYNNGIGTKKNIHEAFKWFKKSALYGDPLGYYKLGCYYSGQGEGIIKSNHTKALEYKLIAADKGYSLAQYDVAAMYYIRGEKDKAIKWWQEAANQGESGSIYALFALYYKGEDVKKDLVLAYGYLKIIERNWGRNKKIDEKQIEIESNLSQEQLKQANDFSKNWNAKQTALTIRASQGVNDARRMVENSKNIQTGK